jgi:hypothetical protein
VISACGKSLSHKCNRKVGSMNLAQAMLAGRILEAFLNDKRSQEAKNKVRKFKTLVGHTPKQIYDFAIFELSM